MKQVRRQCKTKPDMTGTDKMEQDKPVDRTEDWIGDKTGERTEDRGQRTEYRQQRTVHDRTGQNRIRQGRTGQDTEQDRT